MLEDPIECYSYRTFGRLFEGLFLTFGTVLIGANIVWHLAFSEEVRSSGQGVLLYSAMTIGCMTLGGQGLGALGSFLFERLCVGEDRLIYYDKLGRKRVDASMAEIKSLSVSFSLMARSNLKYVVQGAAWRIEFSGYIRN